MHKALKKGITMCRVPTQMALLILLVGWSFVSPPGRAQQSVKIGPSEFTVGGEVKTPLAISVPDLHRMSRTTVHVTNPHNHQEEVYEGVPLAALLAQAGVPQGEQIRGPWMASYVLAEAADGYRVVFSLAELDAGFLDSEVLVADTMDGMPIGAGEGPFKLVAPHEKRPARWVRMLKSLTVVQVPK
jgi:DMSO/TMAO reductase YedYZ molybdopterin-dependent catalytic subunit